ncbi:MAG: hypothetical protein KDD60_06665, partial [Bdellovibrionales bacterium]|nr:hypothetical protein [Bdellovibrionales bacterium]
MQRDFPQPQSQIRDLSTDLRSAREGDGHQDLVLPAHVDFNHSGPNQSSVHDRNRIHSDGMLLFGE